MGKIRIGIVGCGAIGSSVATFVDKRLSKRMRLIGIYDVDKKKIESVLKEIRQKPRFFEWDEVVRNSDLIVEAANIETAKKLIFEGIKNKKDLVILSVGVFVKYPRIFKLIKKSQSNLYIPSGAICGVDGLNSLNLAHIKKLELTTSKPPRSLKGVPYLVEKKIDVLKIKKERIVFSGGITEAIKYFPQNINIAASIFLASRFKDIKVVIKVAPNLKRNTHRIVVKAQEADMTVEVGNMPSLRNPKTSYLAILSTQALLEKIVSKIKVGS